MFLIKSCYKKLAACLSGGCFIDRRMAVCYNTCTYKNGKEGAVCVNVYDFDKTIYDGDSTAHFYFYCVRRFPSVLFWLPYQGFSFLLYVLGVYKKTQFKERFYRFFRRVKDIETVVEQFWNEKQGGIKAWYLAGRKEDDVIISASPEFLLRPICNRLGIRHLIASRVDARSGAYDGQNCYGEEKALRFRAEFPDGVIDNFYSDSLSDAPLAHLATEQAYLVAGETLLEWNKYKETHK